MSDEPDAEPCAQLVSPSNRFRTCIYLTGREIEKRRTEDPAKGFSEDREWLRFVAARLGEIYERLTSK